MPSSRAVRTVITGLMSNGDQINSAVGVSLQESKLKTQIEREKKEHSDQPGQKMTGVTSSSGAVPVERLLFRPIGPHAASEVSCLNTENGTEYFFAEYRRDSCPELFVYVFLPAWPV